MLLDLVHTTKTLWEGPRKVSTAEKKGRRTQEVTLDADNISSVVLVVMGDLSKAAAMEAPGKPKAVCSPAVTVAPGGLKATCTPAAIEFSDIIASSFQKLTRTRVRFLPELADVFCVDKFVRA